MSNPVLVNMAMSALDEDLQRNVNTGYIDIRDAIQLQMLRVMYRVHPNVMPIPPGNTNEAWSADGKTWLPKAPGT